MPRIKRTKLKPSKEVVRKLISNKGEPSTECVKILGTLEALYSISDFWEHNAGEIHLIATNELLEYSDKEEFDSNQLKAYKIGLAAIPLFFQKCFEEKQEIEERKLKATMPQSIMAEA